MHNVPAGHLRRGGEWSGSGWGWGVQVQAGCPRDRLRRRAAEQRPRQLQPLRGFWEGTALWCSVRPDALQLLRRQTPLPTALPAAPRAQPQSPRCLPCRPGTYAYTWGSSHCKHCIAGTYAPAARSSLCTMCPANWTSTEDGQAACAVRVTPAVDYRQRCVREGVGGSRGGGRERAACPTSSIAARSRPRPCGLPAAPGRLRSRAAQPLGPD